MDKRFDPREEVEWEKLESLKVNDGGGASISGREALEEYLAQDSNGTKQEDFIRPSDKQIGGDHYKGMKIQPSEFIEANELSWCEGNAVKYICRHKMKGKRDDLLKAIHYLELALEWEYNYVKDTDSGQ